MNKNDIYRRIPGVDRLMQEERIRRLTEESGYDVVLGAVRTALDRARERLGLVRTEEEASRELACLPDQIEGILKEWTRPHLKRVINGTGIVLHTGLGRAPLSREAAEHGARIAASYSNLEYDLEQGTRGDRCSHFQELLCRLTGFQDAMAVNNNAGAVLLTLAALAEGGQVVISRGELVEIGGKFRVPEIMALSRAVMREVGTTNRTHLSDYEQAVEPETKAFLKVHTSNYRILGFTSSVSVEELKTLGERYGIPVIEDLGSGVFVNLERYGLAHEPTVQEAARRGADVVTFSGDKLLGGPQAGIIAGKKEYIDRIRRHPLARALRIDKFTAGVLEAVMLEYLDPGQAAERIPALRMLTRSADSLKAAGECLAEQIRCAIGPETHKAGNVQIRTEPCVSRAGGGALPLEEIPGWGVWIRPDQITAAELDRRMRQLPVPVIGRIREDRYLLDMRTIGEEDISYIAQVFRDGKILSKS